MDPPTSTAKPPVPTAKPPVPTVNPPMPYGHVPGIAWGETRDGLLAEYGRLKRCLSSGILAPNVGGNMHQWRQKWMHRQHKRMSRTDEKEKKAVEQMKRLQTRMQMVNHAIYHHEVALNLRKPEPHPAPGSEKKYRDVALLIREMTIEQSGHGDHEVRPNLNAKPPQENATEREWTSKQIKSSFRGRYRPSDGYILERPKFDAMPYSATLGVTAVDNLTLDELWESDDEEDSDDDYTQFLTNFTATVTAADADKNPHEVALPRLARERLHLRRIMHAVELEIKHCVVLRAELSFQRTEQQRVDHYWARMNQIRAALRNIGDETDLSGKRVLYDAKRGRAATPPPSPEPCPW